jgi:hypothetical protein
VIRGLYFIINGEFGGGRMEKNICLSGGIEEE